MAPFRVKTTECRVGVVGLYNSGKTVLLTSLINHLQDHDPSRFPVGTDRVNLRKFRALPPEPGWEAFNYAGHRDALVHGGRWPAKTTDRSMFACQFERSDWVFSDALLKLYDLPGERIADAVMVGRDYAAWSDHMVALLQNDTVARTAADDFLAAGSAERPTEPDTLAAYKLALARLILAYKPYVSPSVFLLDPRGRLARPDRPEALAAARLAGIDAQNEFAPLPAAARDRRPELAALFARRYEDYRDRVVLPLVRTLKACHALVVLVDVTMLLAGGTGMYDDNRQVLADLLDVLAPGENLLGRLARLGAHALLPHDWRPGWITRIAFVAPKLDLVHPLDRDRMVGLLKRMVERYARNRDGLNAAYLNCSAVMSARVFPDPAQRILLGVPLRDATGRKIPPGEEQKFPVSELPDDWPLSWEPGRYTFPEVYPRVPPRKDCPPDQVNLDRILNFVLV